jgi:hypothetical protein
MSRMTSRPSWLSLGVVAPASLAFLAATVMWVSGHDPRAADAPPVPSVEAAAGSTAAVSSAAAPSGDVSLGLESSTSLRLSRLQVLLGQAEAQLLQLDRGAADLVQAPSPVLVDVSPPTAANRPRPGPPHRLRTPRREHPVPEPITTSIAALRNHSFRAMASQVTVQLVGVDANEAPLERAAACYCRLVVANPRNCHWRL